MSIGNHHLLVGRNHVEVIRKHHRTIARFVYFHARGLRKQGGEYAFVIGTQVLNVDERHPGFGGRLLRNWVTASSPPADAPIATIGKRLSFAACRVTDELLSGEDFFLVRVDDAMRSAEKNLGYRFDNK